MKLPEGTVLYRSCAALLNRAPCGRTTAIRLFQTLSIDDVVQSRIFLTDGSCLDEVIRVLAEKFANVRPTNTTVICQLPVPKAKVEIEVTARRHL
jgi:enamine deaminase RidA (YjgF/YER057c/UK114 family)